MMQKNLRGRQSGGRDFALVLKKVMVIHVAPKTTVSTFFWDLIGTPPLCFKEGATIKL